jgi:hypothetical protein
MDHVYQKHSISLSCGVAMGTNFMIGAGISVRGWDRDDPSESLWCNYRGSNCGITDGPVTELCRMMVRLMCLLQRAQVCLATPTEQVMPDGVMLGLLSAW